MLEAEDLLVVPVGRLLQATRRSVNSGGERESRRILLFRTVSAAGLLMFSDAETLKLQCSKRNE